MKQLLKKIPYKHRIAMVILLFALLPGLFAETIYLQNVQQEWKEDALSEYQSDADSCALLMSQNITNLLSKMEYVRNNYSIRYSISQLHTLPLVQALDVISQMNQLVGSITADSPALEIRWYPHSTQTAYGRYCQPLSALAKEFPFGSDNAMYYKIIALDEGQTIWHIRDVVIKTNNIPDKQETRLFMYTQIKSFDGADCVLEFSIPTSQILEKHLSTAAPNSIFAVCLDNNTELVDMILESSVPEQETQFLIHQYRNNSRLPDYTILSVPIPNVPNSDVVYMIPATYTRSLIRPQLVKFIIISVLLLILIISTCYLTAHLLTKRMVQAVKQINTDLNRSLSGSAESNFIDDDISEISQIVRKMIHNAQEYSAKIENYKAENLRMELELLQMRFNPHLLYNTLSVIRYKIRDPEARDSIDSLSRYYRIVLNNGHLFIRLKDEIEMVQEFLAVEKFDYQLNSIDFQFEIDERVTNHTIIKHLLQPIVENAVKHGLRPAGPDHQGVLLIQAFPEEDTICIRIIDNGVGMPPESIEKLLTTPSASVCGHGYGIYNVQQRVQVYYGPQYGLQIESTVNQGTTVTLRIPATLSDQPLRKQEPLDAASSSATIL
ncbi:MAG: histidine kinase [Oscillospiraceae bacterium]|nr:histidine kinase [Oscillospiraceae bacterium]